MPGFSDRIWFFETAIVRWRRSFFRRVFSRYKDLGQSSYLDWDVSVLYNHVSLHFWLKMKLSFAISRNRGEEFCLRSLLRLTLLRLVFMELYKLVFNTQLICKRVQRSFWHEVYLLLMRIKHTWGLYFITHFFAINQEIVFVELECGLVRHISLIIWFIFFLLFMGIECISKRWSPQSIYFYIPKLLTL